MIPILSATISRLIDNNRRFVHVNLLLLLFGFSVSVFAASGQTTLTTEILHREVLPVNIKKGVNVLNQSMINAPNTNYVIQNDYVLEENLSIPLNSVLSFEGGSISASANNVTIKGNGTIIESGPQKIFGEKILLKGTWNVIESYVEWFGLSPGADATYVINKALSTFGKVVLMSNKTYVANGTINLDGEKCLQLGHKTTLLKEANNTDPIISITGGKNSLLGESKESVIKSSHLTPYGLVSVCDYKESVWKSTTFYNRIDNLSLRGCDTYSNEVQSIGLRFKHVYKEKGLLYASYYNSFTNLWFLNFNIGILFKGDVNANFIRDVFFTYCGTGDFETDAGITFESDTYYPDGGVCACQENEVANVFVTGAWKKAGAACLCLKGKIHYNTFIISGENGNAGYGLRVVGDQSDILYNNFITEFVQYLGDANADNIYKTNVWLDGRGMSSPNIKTKKIVSDEIDGGFVLNRNGFYKDAYFNYSCKLGTMIEGKPYSIFSYSFVNSTNVRELIKYQLSIYTANGYCNGVVDASVVIQNGSVIYYDAPVIKGVQIQKPVIKGNEIYFIVKPEEITGKSVTNAAAYLSAQIVSGRTATKDIVSAIHIPQTDSKGYLIPYTEKTERAYLGKSGTTVQRPSYPTEGMYFFDTSLNRPKTIWYNNSGWYEFDGAKAGVDRSGPYKNRPSAVDIYSGFQYFNTDTHKTIIWSDGKWWNPDGTEATR